VSRETIHGLSPRELQPGDRFRHKGRTYEAREVKLGKYSVWRVRCRLLDLEDVGLSHEERFDVSRPSEVQRRASDTA
jgi:hypothetical protein